MRDQTREEKLRIYFFTLGFGAKDYWSEFLAELNFSIKYRRTFNETGGGINIFSL